MRSNCFWRIVLGAAVLLIAIIVLQQWLWRVRSGQAATTPVEPATVASPSAREAPTAVASPRRGIQFQPASRALAASDQPAPAQKLFVEWKGSWYPAEIIAPANGSTYIRYSGYGPEWDEWVTVDRMRYTDRNSIPADPPADTPPAETERMTPLPGDPVVHWGSRWWRAEVLQTEGDQSLIRYVGYGAEWDEWVGADRFKVYSEQDVANDALSAKLTEPPVLPEPQTNPAALIQGSPAKGDLLVEYGKQWWPAEILKQDGDKYLIHYKGYGSHWDEWITTERLGLYSGNP